MSQHGDNEPTPEPRIPTDAELEEIVEGVLLTGTEEEQAKQIFKSGLVPAVRTIVSLSTLGNSERIRLEAAKIVVDRNLGKETLGGDLWDNLLREFSGGTEEGK